MNALATSPAEAPAEERTLLQGVSWEEYVRLNDEYDDSAGPRFTCDSGNLEITTISIEHDEPNRTLAALVEAVLVEWDIDFLRAGSNTFRRRDLAKGFEPDSSFYIENAAVVRGKKRLDLHFDPPPDLAVEVEVTRSLLPKVPILAAVGVPEVWGCENEQVQIFCLGRADYRPSQQSRALAPLSAAVLTSFLQKSASMTGPAWTRAVREWAQAHAR